MEPTAAGEERSVQVGFFTECYRPIVNGVVASIDALRDGLVAHGVEVTTIAPRFPHFVDDEGVVVRVPVAAASDANCISVVRSVSERRDRRRVHALDVVHAHSPFVTGWMAISCARRMRVPLVFTYHTRLDAYAHYAPFDRVTTERAMSTLTRRYANAADTVVVPTRAMETRLREIGVHAPIAVVPSAIDVERFAGGRRSALVRARLGAGEDEPLALVVSRLGTREEHRAGARRAAGVSASCAWPSSARARIAPRSRSARAGSESRDVSASPGTLPRERLPDVYASADAFVFPSTSETQGLVLAEALAAGLPVVAADSEASRDVLTGGRPDRRGRARGVRRGPARSDCVRARSECRTFGILAVYRRDADAAHPRNLPGGARRESRLTRTYVRYRMIARAMTSRPFATAPPTSPSASPPTMAARASPTPPSRPGRARNVVKVPFAARPLAALDGREFGYAAVGAVAGYLRGRGFTRVRIRLADPDVVDDLNARGAVPPALAMPYVKTRCALHGFTVARVERGEPIETHDLEARARADIALRSRAAA